MNITENEYKGRCWYCGSFDNYEVRTSCMDGTETHLRCAEFVCLLSAGITLNTLIEKEMI